MQRIYVWTQSGEGRMNWEIGIDIIHTHTHTHTHTLLFIKEIINEN